MQDFKLTRETETEIAISWHAGRQEAWYLARDFAQLGQKVTLEGEKGIALFDHTGGGVVKWNCASPTPGFQWNFDPYTICAI